MRWRLHGHTNKHGPCDTLDRPPTATVAGGVATAATASSAGNAAAEAAAACQPATHTDESTKMDSSTGSFDSPSAEQQLGLVPVDCLGDRDEHGLAAARSRGSVPAPLAAAVSMAGWEPFEQEPLVHVPLPKLTLEDLRQRFQSYHWPITHFLKTEYGAFDFSETGWVITDQGKHVRNTCLQMPTPADVPRALMRLVGAPDHATSNMDYTCSFEDDHLVLVQRTSATGIVYSEYFRVWDAFSFKPRPSGGTMLMRWTKVEWILDLPWTHRMIKYFVEKKTMESARASTNTLVRILQEGAQ